MAIFDDNKQYEYQVQEQQEYPVDENKNTVTKAPRHAKNHINTRVIIIITAVVALLIGIATTLCVVNIINNDGNKEETKFVEEPVQKVEAGEMITVYDPELGEIQFEAVEGFPKNTYNADNFTVDDKGLMTYHVDGKVASCMGVDLSDYQGDVDFDKLKNQGIDFVMLRIGGRYYSEKGALYMDKSFFDNYVSAKKAGLDVGGYFFSQAKNAQEAENEANYVLKNLDSIQLDYPIAFDWELISDDDARTDNVSNTELTDAAIVFCDTLTSAGYKSIIYSNTYQTYYKYELERIKDYDLWIADYEYSPSMYYNFTMWQYSVNGKLDGIESDVDLNICLKNY